VQFRKETIVASNGALYGIIGALGVVAVGGGVYIAKQEGAFGPATTTALTAPAPAPSVPAPSPPPAPAPKPPVATAPPPAPPPPPAAPTGAAAAQAEQVHVLVLDARRAIARGEFNNAARALDQAEQIDPRSSEMIAARRDLREAQQQAGRNDRRIDTLVSDARTAIARHDYVAADRLLDQAEHIDSHDPTVQRARSELNAQQANRDDRRVNTLVAQARAAIGRHDYATADRLLDQAEDLDAHDRDVQQARAELNAAQRWTPGPRR
jgi:uncharacterized protein HemY